jgi:hypothetical protein
MMLSASALDGKVRDISALKGQWLLVSVTGGACNGEKCEKNLFSKQMRESLGKKRRLDRGVAC